MSDHALNAAHRISDHLEDRNDTPYSCDIDGVVIPIIAHAIDEATLALRRRLAAVEAGWRKQVVDCEQEACGQDHLDVARLWLTKADAYREAADQLKAALENREC